MWNRFADVLRMFSQVEMDKGQSLLDRTTILVVSEFSRMPALNGAKGKDHNPWSNSALMMGPGIKGGSVFGQSKLIPSAVSASDYSYFVGLPHDLSSGEAVGRDVKGKYISTLAPAHLYATIATSMGFDLHALGLILGCNRFTSCCVRHDIASSPNSECCSCYRVDVTRFVRVRSTDADAGTV
ncbi:unnamed protein product [Sphagnum jensenii]